MYFDTDAYALPFLTVPNVIEKKTDTLNTARRDYLEKNKFSCSEFHMVCYSKCRHVVSTHGRSVKVILFIGQFFPVIQARALLETT